MFKKSIRAQVLGLLGGSLLLMLVIALAGFQLLSADLHAYRALLTGPLKSTQLIDEANLQFKGQVQEWKNVLLRGKDPAALAKYWQQFETQEAEVQRVLDALLALEGVTPAVRSQVERLKAEHRSLGSAYRAGREAFMAAGADAAAGDQAVKGIDRATSEQMGELVVSLREQADEQSSALIVAAERTVLFGTLALIASGLAVALISLWLVNRNLVAPISLLISHVTALSRGRFAERVAVERQDELGDLAIAANTLREFLADTFNRLQSSTADLDRASGELNAIAAVMAEGTREQFQRTDQVATAMEEMSASAQEVARHAATAASAADEADRSAQAGEQVMAVTVNTITRMRGEIASTAEVIRRLESDSGRIGTVLEVIRGIAEQTNLLALNAAIEAARAGDQGRGFAVVADEVRTLAQRTAASTAEIHQIIDTVQTGAEDAVRAIQTGQARSDEGVEQVTRAGEMLHRITEAVEAIRDMNRQIATAAEEQNSVVEDISRNLTEITAIATTNQENVQRTESASTHLHELSGQLGQVTARMSA
ncbi:methyl-accepting chemotaxis protein [Stutzerimonas urumqiensis]|uniref:methyl-accepting chemotaxis protein n=1 Tax=Stutzerimonas urumqiensis TaxID=638269 RepID=UPI003BAAE1E7